MANGEEGEAAVLDRPAAAAAVTHFGLMRQRWAGGSLNVLLSIRNLQGGSWSVVVSICNLQSGINFLHAQLGIVGNPWNL